VLCVYNEQERITARLNNLRSCDYPPDCLEIIVVSDGSTDHTVDRCTEVAAADARIRLIVRPQRMGKADALNAGVAAARHDLIVFADARQDFATDTFRRLVWPFADPKVGAVTGELEIATTASQAGSGIDVYWRIERSLRFQESLVDSCIGCTGAVYAIRRGLWRPLPPDTLLDDVVVPMRIVLAGYRVLHEPSAKAFDPQPLEPEREKLRKRRTLAGNFQMLFRYPSWLMPWRNRCWWQLASHKYARLAGPWLLALLFVSHVSLLQVPVYRGLFVLHALFYLLAAVGLIWRRGSFKVLSLPAGFVFLNVMVLGGLIYYARRRPEGGWEKATGTLPP
jgi:cellulose synthase/poly-beta-1,6-N-acetylglucosamine synthase-like glycosyltransferase